MRKSIFGTAVIAAVVLGAAVPVAAHHGTSITYYADKTMTLTGVVTEFVLGYPHPQLYFDVTDPATGQVQHWGSELAPTPLMMRNIGFKKDSIKAGDKLVLTCSPHKTPGATVCLAREIVINGKLVALNADQQKRVAASEASK
jgi:hypothetical protein